MKHTLFRRPEHAYLAAALLIVAALTLCAGGCRKAPPAPPQPTPTPQPTPALDRDADSVNRATTDDIHFDYRIMLNGVPLPDKADKASAFEILDSAAKPETFYPLRVVGEKLGYTVTWQPRKRRVLWNGSIVPAPVLLLNGRSYLSSTRFENWLYRFDNVASVKSFRFDDMTGYVEVSAKEIKLRAEE